MSNVKKTKAKQYTRKPRSTPRPQKVHTASGAVMQSTGVVRPERVAPRRLPNVWVHLKSVFSALRGQWKFFVAFVVLYVLLNAVFVHNFTQDVQSLKEQLAPYVGGNAALTGLGAYAFVVTSGGGSGATTAYLYTLLIVSSLACIWALRKGSTAVSVCGRLRDSYYEGMYPLIPFVVVLFVLTLELFPLAAGGSLLGTVLSNGIANTALEEAVWVLVFVGFAALTFWLVGMSLMAPYIVTLPGGRPWQALRDSKRITQGKRLAIVRRLLFFALVLLVISAGVLIPVIIAVPALTGLVTAVLGAAALPFTHAYFYGLYRELINV